MLHVFAVLAAALLFGTTGTSMALGPDDTTPLSVGAVRLVIGGTGLALIAFVLARRHARRPPSRARSPEPSKGGIRPLALMVLTGFCLALYQPLFFLGTERNGVAVGTVVALGSAPILAGLLEWGLTRRVPSGDMDAGDRARDRRSGAARLRRRGPTAGGGGGTDPIGLLGERRGGSHVRRDRQRAAPTARRGLGSVHRRRVRWVRARRCSRRFVLPFVDLSWLATTAGLVMALWLGIATISIAYVMFTWGLGGLTAATAATLTLGEPLTASILGIVVLGERLSVLAIVGLVILAAGLALLAWGSRAPRDPVPFAVEG